MSSILWKLPQFCFLIWLFAPVLTTFYNLEGEQWTNAEESVIGLQNLLINVQSSLKDVNTKLDNFGLQMAKPGEKTVEPTTLRHCADVYDQKSKLSGIYTIQPSGSSEPFQVYCDMRTDGGGWTVFQKRGDFLGIPTENFKRGWIEYKNGFGDLATEFWIGLYKIALMTKLENGYQELRVDLADWEGKIAYAKYQNFTIQDETEDFILGIESYTGNAGDSLSPNRRNKFSTSDHNNNAPATGNSALEKSGGWWFDGYSCLNCLNLKNNYTPKFNGIYWYDWKGLEYSLSQAEMKFRPMGWTSKRK